MTQVAIPTALLARMSTEIENVRYAKVEAPPTAPKITNILKQAEGDIALLGGLNGNFLIEELDRGSTGVMPGSDLCGPFLRLWKVYHSGDRKGARAEFQRMLPMIRYELQPGLGVSVMKHNLKKRGIINCAAVRSPTKTLDPIGIREAEELRQELALE